MISAWNRRWCGVGILAVAAFASACAAQLRVTGFVRPQDPTPRLETSQGEAYTLVLDSGSEALRYLDGHLVRIEGLARGKRVEVGAWSIAEGLHGLATWVGLLQSGPGGVFLVDKENGAPLQLDADAAEMLAPWVGRPVLVEGYRDQHGTLRVAYYRPLFDEARAAGAP